MLRLWLVALAALLFWPSPPTGTTPTGAAGAPVLDADPPLAPAGIRAPAGLDLSWLGDAPPQRALAPSVTAVVAASLPCRGRARLRASEGSHPFFDATAPPRA